MHRLPTLFRAEVMNARKERLYGDVNVVVPVSWQAIGYLMFFALVTAFVFLFSATYARVETVTGSVVIDKGTAQIVPTRIGVIADLPVRDGQHVGKGQILARVRAEEDLANGETAPQRILDALKEQDRQLGTETAFVLDAATAERSRLLTTIDGARTEVETLEQQIEDQQRLVALAENEFRQIQAIASKGFLSRRDLDSRESALIARRQQLAQLRQARAAKLTSLDEARRTIAHSDASAQAQAVAVQSRRTELAQQIAQYDAAKGYILTSPIEGTVTALTARLGQPVDRGQPLMVIMPDDGRTRVELHVPPSAAGFLANGQQVRLAIDAFPYQRFGTVTARITDISGTVIAKPTSADGAVPVYLVTAELAHPHVIAFGRKQHLLPGMTLTARIVTRKQSLLEWAFEPLFAVGRR